MAFPPRSLAAYLRDNWIVPEKNDLNCLLFLLTPGVESEQGRHLLSALVRFKELHDANALLEEVMTEFVARAAQRYGGDAAARSVRRDARASSASNDTSALQRAQFRAGAFARPGDAAAEAVQRLVRNEVDYLPIDRVAGRIATTLLLVYPPGIATIVPGERLDERAQPMLDYLQVFERAANLFPGFETEIQGVYRETGPDGATQFWTYVVREA